MYSISCTPYEHIFFFLLAFHNNTECGRKEVEAVTFCHNTHKSISVSEQKKEGNSTIYARSEIIKGENILRRAICLLLMSHSVSMAIVLKFYV